MARLTIQDELKALGCQLDPECLENFVQLLAGAQRERVRLDQSTSEEVTRSTALLVLARLDARVISGALESIEPEPDADGIKRLPTRVREVFPDQPILRQEAINFAGIKKRVWRASVRTAIPVPSTSS